MSEQGVALRPSEPSPLYRDEERSCEGGHLAAAALQEAWTSPMRASKGEGSGVGRASAAWSALDSS